MRILPYYHLTTLHLLISLGQGMVQAVAFKFQLTQRNDPLIREMAAWSIASALLAAEHEKMSLGWLKVSILRFEQLI